MKESQKIYKFDPHRIGIIPKKYRDNQSSDIDTDEKREIFEQAMEGKSLFIHGGAGTGKTFLSFIVAKYMTGIHEDIPTPNKLIKSVEYISFPSFIIELQSSFNEKINTFELLNDKAKNPNFLLIDDFGADGLTDFIRRIIYFLINERDLCGKQTIITSNYSLEEIDRQIDPRISSRIAGMCEIINLTGKDRRIK